MLHFQNWNKGRDGSVPLILLHGFGGCAQSWQFIASRMSTDRSVYAFDLPGHGRSLGMERTGVKASVTAVLQTIDMLQFSPFHIVGHSMGGAVAALIALQRPFDVKTLTLLAPGGFGPDIASELLRHYACASDDNALQIALSAMYAPYNTPSGNEINNQLAMRQTPGQIEALVSLEKRLSKNGKQGELDRDALANLSFPLNVIWGDLDPVISVAQTKTLPDRFIAHTLSNVGHMLLDESPDRVSRILQQIIGDQSIV